MFAAILSIMMVVIMGARPEGKWGLWDLEAIAPSRDGRCPSLYPIITYPGISNLIIFKRSQKFISLGVISPLKKMLMTDPIFIYFLGIQAI